MDEESALRIEYMPLSKLVSWPRNPKDHDLPLLQASMRRFGFTQPILIDERSGQMVAGHGRVDSLRVMKVAGAEPPERIRVDGDEWLVPVLRGVAFENNTEAEAYGLVDNRATEKGGWNDDMLSRVLVDLVAQDAMQGVGWTEEEIDNLISDSSPMTKGDPVPEMALLPFETYDYVMLVFKNTWDWERAVDLLGIEPRGFTVASGKKRKVGLCRVLDGAEVLKMFES